MALSLNHDIFKSFKLAKTFKQPQQSTDARLLAMDFDDTGEYCITSNTEDTMVLYDCLNGKERKTLFSKKYGIHHVKFTHSPSTIIHSSTKEDDNIRYMSLHDNKYLRYFRGHKGRVVSMDMSPSSDLFLSAALDDTVRLWDLRSNACQGLTNVKGSSLIAFDPQGVMFALALSDASIRFYDLRNYELGPFGMIHPNTFAPGDQWTGLKFSNNLRDMMVSTRNGRIYVVDSMDEEYKLRYTLGGYDNSGGQNVEASFSPDGNYVMSGSENGLVHVWSSSDGRKVSELPGLGSMCNLVQFNPKRLMMVTGSTPLDVGMWIPTLDS